MAVKNDYLVPCAGDTDCASGACCDAGEVGTEGCTQDTCFIPLCANGVLDAGEADVDCGGSTCATLCGAGTSCTSDGDCISDACRTCADGAADFNCKVESALDRLWVQNPRIKTYVIGFAFAEISESLNCAAIYGRTPRQDVALCAQVDRSNCAPQVCDNNSTVVCTSDGDCSGGTCVAADLCEVDGTPCLVNGDCSSGLCVPAEACYFQADDQASLSSAFDEIITEVVSCSYELTGVPPNEFRIFVYLDDGSGELVLIPRDYWDYNPVTNQIEFAGTTCEDVKAGLVTPVVVRGGLPGEDPCPEDI